jgi:hypothetical protein
MSGIATAVVAGSVVTGYLGSKAQSSAASTAAGAQERSAELGIEEQRRQFDELQKVLAPYVTAGTEAIAGLEPYAAAGAPALEQQMALSGAAGPEAQRAAVAALEASPMFQAQVRQGEEALLQQASATGGLRGGNIQAALAQFRPQMLQAEIERQYGRLGGLTALGQTTTQNLAQLGQASAAGQAAAGMESGSAIANLLAQQGAAQAGSALASGQAQAQMWSGIGQTAGSLGTLKLLGAF